MAFVIKPIARDVFDSFWTPDVKRGISASSSIPGTTSPAALEQPDLGHR